jgi:hypothetical protein
MTKIIINDKTDIIGCTDPLAGNYDPRATVSCNDCCTYGDIKIGCIDPLASNYDPTATQSCNNCCEYSGEFIEVNFNELPGFDGFVEVEETYRCPRDFSITQEGVVQNIDTYFCCDENNLGKPPEGKFYFWDGTKCLLIDDCPQNITCIDCQNFDWWNNLYILNHNGQSLQITSPLLWEKVVDLITNSGNTIYINSLTGDLLNDKCCVKSGGEYVDGICFCDTVQEQDFETICVDNIELFMSIMSTDEGRTFFTLNFQNIGNSIGLTSQETDFILLNLFNESDTNGNGVPDNIESRLLLSNALNNSGGFYLSVGVLNGRPLVVNQEICSQNNGYWDGNLCFCNPINDNCDIEITEVEVINIRDIYNNTIQIVVKNNEPITESCCNKLINEYGLSWEWSEPYCYVNKKSDCLPVVYTINDDKVKIPSCSNDLEFSLWLYVGKPEKPCEPIPDPPDDDIIVIDGEFCDIELTPNTSEIEDKPTSNAFYDVDTIIGKGEFGDIGIDPDFSDVEPCCYSNSKPILARIITDNPIINQFLIQNKEYNSNSDYFNKWVQLKTSLPSSGLTFDLDVKLEIYDGLNCCCKYDIFIDDVKVICKGQGEIISVNDLDCPGFNITRVIDNKKSWVYNPGVESVGISDYDVIERSDGSFGLINGEGTINRTFSPSPDSILPWRYTDYFQQSSVYEKHSDLVINSKELGLTFDMCADCPISATTLVCPNGYTLSANTEICYQEINQKIYQDGDDFIFMDGDDYIFQ